MEMTKNIRMQKRKAKTMETVAAAVDGKRHSPIQMPSVNSYTLTPDVTYAGSRVHSLAFTCGAERDK